MKQTAEGLLNQAQTLNEVEKYEEVILILEDKHLIKFNDSNLYAEKAQAYWRLEEYASCAIMVDKALTINPDNPKAINYRGNLYWNKKEYEQAIVAYEKVILLNPNYANPYYGLANIYLFQKNYIDAIKYYKKSIKINPKFVASYTGLGNLYKNLKQYKNALLYYHKALVINPNFVNTYNGLGNVYKANKDYRKAIEYYQKAIKINPKFAPPYYNLGASFFALKQYEKAIEYYNKRIEASRDSSDYYADISKAKIQEIKRIIKSPTYKEINDIVSRIKSTLIYTNNCVTHYTSFSTARALIIDKSKFRISEGTYLNDTSEGRELFTFLPQIFTNEAKSNDTLAKPFAAKPFIGSFVTDNKHDHLALWRMYGKEENVEAKGCAITVDRENFLTNLKSSLVFEDNNDPSDKMSEEFSFYRVTYYTSNSKKPFIIPGAEEKEDAFNKDMCDLFDKTKQYLETYSETEDKKELIEILNSIAYLFKSAEYQYEQELRLIVNGIGMKKIISSNTPAKVYIDLIELNPIIQKITLGPKLERGDECAALLYYALEKDEFNPEICISRLPFK